MCMASHLTYKFVYYSYVDYARHEPRKVLPMSPTFPADTAPRSLCLGFSIMVTQSPFGIPRQHVFAFILLKLRSPVIAPWFKTVWKTFFLFPAEAEVPISEQSWPFMDAANICMCTRSPRLVDAECLASFCSDVRHFLSLGPSPFLISHWPRQFSTPPPALAKTPPAARAKPAVPKPAEPKPCVPLGQSVTGCRDLQTWLTYCHLLSPTEDVHVHLLLVRSGESPPPPLVQV